MKDFPSCLGENGVQVADFPSSNAITTKVSQNVVTCLYQCSLHGKNYWITITWGKNLMGQCLSVAIDNSANRSVCRMEIKPWLFSKKGSKRSRFDSFRIDVYWDLSGTRFGPGPEPLDGFYVGVAFDGLAVLLLGDMRREALEKIGFAPGGAAAVFVSKREHIFGKKAFATRVRFSDVGVAHDLVVECDAAAGAPEPCLAVALDGKRIMRVKRLRWKFRGNDVVLVDDVAVDVFWDVHGWLFGGSDGGAVFVFKTRELAQGEELWRSRPDCNPQSLQRSRTEPFRDVPLQGLGFTLILYAWKSE